MSQTNFDEFIEDIEIPKLDNEEKNELEGLFTLEECKKVLETFEDNKSLAKMDLQLSSINTSSI